MSAGAGPGDSATAAGAAPAASGSGATSSSMGPGEGGAVGQAAGFDGGRRVDPLVLLRRCIMANQKVRVSEEFLDFNGRQVPLGAKCGFRLSPTEPLLNIGSVWFMFKQITDDRPYSMDVAKKRRFKYITITHRGDLCDYLVGRLETCRGLDIDVIEGRKRPAEDAQLEAKLGKRAKQRAKDPRGDELAKVDEGAEFKPSDITYADVLARVRPVRDLDALARCPGRTIPNADLILKIAQDEVENWHLPTRIDRAMGTTPSKVPFYVELERFIEENRANKPIILVPCNKNAPINILNAARFLQDGRYAKTDMEHQRFFESTRCEYVDVARNICGKMWTFEVRDSAKSFTKQQWLRVVAVIADGSAWQFTGWPFESVVDLFTSIKGVFFRDVGTLVPLHVREWQVSILQMYQVQFQHRFSEERDAFWKEVERFMNSARDKKFVNHTALETIKLSGEKPKPVL